MLIEVGDATTKHADRERERDYENNHSIKTESHIGATFNVHKWVLQPAHQSRLK
jgi:hypothetical protein